MGNKNDDDGYTPDFSEFWKAYPYRRGSKWNAYRRFKTAVARGISAGEIIAAAGRYAALIYEKGTESKFVPHATTWLVGRCWESIDDEEDAHRESASAVASRSSPAELTMRAVAEWLRPANGGRVLSFQPSIRQG